MRQTMRELAVIRQQERSGRVRVEPADGDDARLVRYEIDHRRAAFRVVCGSDDAGGLVQEHVAEGLQLRPAPRRPRRCRPRRRSCSTPRSLRSPAPALRGSVRRHVVARRRPRARGMHSAASPHFARLGVPACGRSTTLDGQACRARRLRRECPARPARRDHELHRQGRPHPQDRARGVSAWGEVRRRPVLRPVGQARANRAGTATTRSTTSRPGCHSACSTSPTSTPRAYHSPALMRRVRSTASIRHAQDATSSRTCPKPGEVVNRMTTSWCIVPAPTDRGPRWSIPSSSAKRPTSALGRDRTRLPARGGRSRRGLDWSGPRR